MAKPVVVSAQALEGIEAIPGSELIVASTASDFAEAITAVLVDSNALTNAALGDAARLRVQQSYSWASNLARINAQLESDQIELN